MRSVLLQSILCLTVYGCDTKAEHGFISGGGNPGPGAADAPLEAWGDCAQESGVSFSSDSLIQTVPPAGARNVSLHTPIVAFLEEGLTLDDVDALDVYSGDLLIEGDLVELDRGSSVAIAFVPDEPYQMAKNVRIELEVTGGSDSWEFHTGPYEATTAGDPNLSFERAVTGQGVECELTYFTDNFIGFGDVAITDEDAGPTGATEGTQRLLMSTGEVLGNASIRGTTSFVTSQPLPVVDDPQLKFDYRFLSEEFDENIGQVHDDSFMVLAYGKAGVAFEEVTSVNRVGATDSSESEFPGLSGVEASAWRTHALQGFNQLGADATITLIVTDIGSTVRTSAVSIDHLRVE